MSIKPNNKPTAPFEGRRNLDPVFKELAFGRRQSVANAHYWVDAAVRALDPTLVTEVYNDEQAALANAALAASVDIAPAPVQEAAPPEADNFKLGEDDGVNPGLLDALEADKGLKGDYDLAA